MPLSPQTQAVLQEADRTILGMTGGSRYLLYSYLRRTAARVARTDSFYIGFCRGDGAVVFPYNFDGREYDDPNVNACVPGGLTEWIVRNKRAYWSRQDGGALLHRGRAFGDTARRSREGIAAPLLVPEASGRRRRVIGLLSLLSYEEGVYTEETVRFLECLAESLATALRREEEDRARRERIGLPRRPDAHAALADQVSDRLQQVRRRAEALRDRVPEEDADLRALAADLCAECERCQTETFELLTSGGANAAAPAALSPLARLTPREREVAALIAGGRTNGQIAEALYISEKTAKTHCASIIRKLEAGGRSGVTVLLRPYLSATPTPSE